MSQSLKSGVIWSALERFSTQGISFLLSIVVARLVLPSDYGLIAMLGIFLAIAQTFIDSGFSSALIQKKDKTDSDFATVFYFNAGVSVLVYIILYLLAPYIASFYEEPQLLSVCRWVGLNLIIDAFVIIPRTKLTINLDFKQLTRVSLIATVVSGILAIILAYKGVGVWALVVQSLTATLVKAGLLWSKQSFPSISKVSKSSFQSLFSFGSKLLIGGLMQTIYTNLYTLVIGKFFNVADVGCFNRSKSIADFPSYNISSIVTRVMYPKLCNMQGDEAAITNVFFKALRSTLFFVFPGMFLLLVLSKSTILALLTPKWVHAVPMLSIMCFALMWIPLMQMNWTLLNVKGRSDLALKSEIIKKIVAISVLLCSIPFGIYAVCWSLVLYSFADIIIIIAFVRKIYNFGYLREVKEVTPLFLCSLMMSGCVYGFIQFFDNYFLQIFLGGIFGICVYLGLSLLFRIEEVYLLFNAIRRLRK